MDDETIEVPASQILEPGALVKSFGLRAGHFASASQVPHFINLGLTPVTPVVRPKKEELPWAARMREAVGE